MRVLSSLTFLVLSLPSKNKIYPEGHRSSGFLIYISNDAIKGTFQIKSRTGTGSSSSSSPASITFDFAPSIIIPLEYKTDSSGGYINLYYSNYWTILRTDNLTTSFAQTGWGHCNSIARSLRVKKSSDGKTIYWYLWDQENFNESGYVYYFIGMR